MFLATEPASTGTTEPAATPCRIARRSSSAERSLALQVLGHQVVVALDGGLNELLAILRRRLRDVGGHVARGHFVVREGICLTRHEIDDAGETGLIADGNRQWHHRIAEMGPQRGERRLEAGVLAVKLVDEDESGQVGAVGIFPGELRADLDALVRGDHYERGVRHPQSRMDLAGEIRVARGV